MEMPGTPTPTGPAERAARVLRATDEGAAGGPVVERTDLRAELARASGAPCPRCGATPPTGMPAVPSTRDAGPVATAGDPEARPSPEDGTGLGGDLDGVAGAAADAAAAAAADLGLGGGDSPACTYVAAVVRGADAVV